MSVTLAPSAHAAILAAAAASAPDEACGLLLGHHEHIAAAPAVANVAATRRTCFELDPLALIAAHKAARAGGLALLGYWHSHPTGPSAPSATDQAAASGDGRVWAIAADGVIRLWVDLSGGFAPLSYALADG